MPAETDVVIIGGGLAGLAAARRLHRAGVPWLLVEATDRLGGRVATDTVDGYLLDRGFQVLNTGYPRLGTLLDVGPPPPEPVIRAELGRLYHCPTDDWISLTTVTLPAALPAAPPPQGRLRKPVALGDGL
jgi:phytoene dehydrogenase-like protein